MFTGLRPGEKLFEELEISGEQIAKTRHPKIFIGKLAVYPSEYLQEGLKRLAVLCRQGHGRDSEIRNLLGDFLSEANLMDNQPAADVLQFPGRSSMSLVGRSRS